MSQNPPKNVAVIGAGPAGLVAARELQREGHNVVVFERENQVGGTWIYNPATDSDPMGVDPSRKIVHSSLYSPLRINLPREIMGFRDYPFVATKKPDRDPRRFPGHKEVLDYLNDFAVEFGLIELVRFGNEVGYVGFLEDGKWKVCSRKRESDDVVFVNEEEYDAVVICNGCHTQPRIADDIPGIEVWPGKQIHSHNYRIPEPFRDQLDYEDWLAAECGSSPPEEWRKQMWIIARDKIKTQPVIYRDLWDDDDLTIQAHQDFAKYIPDLAQSQNDQHDFYGKCGMYYS
ncbi:Flavin-containing monooxygenase FMO GS-OX-like 3 [Capsicum annuum]|nr:Flavin-containing monooxygenase FMO GS-OX-like 3 [Capsicum annuum]